MLIPRKLSLIVILILVSFLSLLLLGRYQPTITSDSNSRIFEQQQQQKSHQEPKDLAPRPIYDPAERYLAYLPHSGFHNQRITLENALLLAKYLNRTLLVPPVFLGPATEWRQFDILHRRILLQTKRGLDHCNKIPRGDPLPAECLNYYSWTTVDWDFFYDMEKIKTRQPFKFRTDHSFSWLEHHLGIDRQKDIHIFYDKTHYDYQIYDNPDSTTPLNTARYLRRIDVSELQAIQHRVLHMGSLFATGRVLAELPESKVYQQFLRRTMILNTPILVKTSDAIVNTLGGLGSFVGLHLRVGDGMFIQPAPTNVENMFQSLVNITGITPIPNYQIIPSSSPSDTTGPAGQDLANKGNKGNKGVNQDLDDSKPKARPAPTRLDISECLAHRNEGGKYTVIYIATDGVYPRRNILFRKLFDHFPCIFTLDDFSTYLAELKEMKNLDGVGLSKDLIPMVDAVVSAKGRYFFGTPKSTFSTYVQKQLHPAFVEGMFDSDGTPL